MSLRTQKIPFIAWLVVALLGLTSACANIGAGGKVPPLAPVVNFGEKIGGRLECLDDRCTDWYKLPVASGSELTIRVDSRSKTTRADFGIALSDREMTILEHSDEPDRRPRIIRTRLEPGTYYISVYGIDNPTDPVSYILSANTAGSRAGKKSPAAVAKPKAASPPPPRPAPVAPAPVVKKTSDDASEPNPILFSCAVLDTEFKAGIAVAVLIDAGARKGAIEGQQGQLLNEGVVIGRFEIADVYAIGSRGRILGELTGDIRYDTTAEILAPLDSQ